MNIQRVDTYPLFYRLPKPYGDANGIKSYRTCYLIRITTESGVDGWGECVDWLPTLHKGFQERIIPNLIGKSIFDRARIVRTLQKWHKRSAAAISMALTEAAAKACGISVCSLWGGKLRDKIPVYASFQSYSECEDWQKRSLKGIEHAVNQGFDQIKVKIGGKSIDEDQRHVSSVQALLHGRIRLALDANQSYDLSAALQWQSMLRNWTNLLWLEEPMPMNRIAEYALLRSRLVVPLAGGENMETCAEYISVLTQQALDFLTPDSLHMTGIDEYQATLRMARSFGVRITPHAYDGALTRLYAIMAQACLEPWGKLQPDAIEPVEWDAMDNPFTSVLPLPLSNGFVTVPEGQGIGLEPDLDMLTHYRWDGSVYS